jgi:hypothetical protein
VYTGNMYTANIHCTADELVHRGVPSMDGSPGNVS